MKNKKEENENKIILGDFNCILWIKWTGMRGAKPKDFIDGVPITLCQNMVDNGYEDV